MKTFLIFLLGGISLVALGIFLYISTHNMASVPQTQISPTVSIAPSTIPFSPTPIITSVTTNTQQYTLEDVAKHNTASDCWIVVNTTVYNATDFIQSHPRATILIKACGQDASKFSNIMTSRQKDTLSQYAIGSIK